jgi:hypothetical protein
VYLKLPSNYVDPQTHAPLPDAVLVIDDTEFRMRAGDTRISAAVYASAEAVVNARPVVEFPIALSIAERNSQLPGLLQALYTVVAARPEYAGAELVP